MKEQYSFAVLTMLTLFGIIPVSISLLAPLVGLLTGLMFGALALFVTSFVKTINHFNFFMTGIIDSMASIT